MPFLAECKCEALTFYFACVTFYEEKLKKAYENDTKCELVIKMLCEFDRN